MRTLAVTATCPQGRKRVILHKVVEVSRAPSGIRLPLVSHSDEGRCGGDPWQTHLTVECAFHKGSLSEDLVQEKQGYHFAVLSSLLSVPVCALLPALPRG